MTFLYLVPTGMNDPEQPTWGSWAGRYGLNDEYQGRPYYWANQQDHWRGTTNRDNMLLRWAVHLQNDFKSRMDWCVNDRTKANHPPLPQIRGELRRTVRPGTKVSLDASGSTDPDKQNLKFEWVYYPEPGSFRGAAPEIESAMSSQASLIAPQVESVQTVHIILIVTDDGTPPLTRYQRIILTLDPSAV